LTSGEKVFIGLFFSPIALLSVGVSEVCEVVVGAEVLKDWSAGYIPKNTYHSSLDLSKITNVNIDFNDESGGYLYWVDANNNKIKGINYSNNEQVPSNAKGIMIHAEHVSHFRIRAFTTTDGKVHTADNLNY